MDKLNPIDYLKKLGLQNDLEVSELLQGKHNERTKKSNDNFMRNIGTLTNG